MAPIISAATSHDTITPTPTPNSSPTKPRPALADLTKPAPSKWKNSWCCQCSAWYVKPDLQNGLCINTTCDHTWCTTCLVSTSNDRNAPRTHVKNATGILKSICCCCETHHAGMDLSDEHCYEGCGHILCGECMVYTDARAKPVHVDQAGMKFSVCCQQSCGRYFGGSLVLEEGACRGCDHLLCEKCFVRVKNEAGTWATMQVGVAKARELVPRWVFERYL